MEALDRFKPKDGRLLAVVLLLIVVLLVYLIAIHWWFVAPQMQYSTEMGDLREQQLRYRQTIDEKPQIERKLAEVRAYEQNNQAFLAESDPNAAQAGLIQRIKQSVAEHGKDEARCTVASSQGYAGTEEELYKRVTVQARIRCDLEPLAAILYDLEDGKPYLFIDRLVVYKQQNYTPRGGKPVSNPLDVQINVSGYLRQPGKTK